jgi:hypothetical protein
MLLDRRAATGSPSKIPGAVRVVPPTASLRPARALAHPAWLAALVVLALNDHVAKGAGLLPSVVTGKASDVAGLFVVPALLATLARARTRRGLLVAHVLPALVFAAIKVSPAASAAFEGALGLVGLPWHNVVDPSDLLALPAVVLAYGLLRARMAAPLPTGRWSRLGVLAGVPAVLASGSPGGANQGGAAPGSGDKGVAVSQGALAVDPTGRFYFSEQGGTLVLGDLRTRTSRVLTAIGAPDRLAFFEGERAGIFVVTSSLHGAPELVAYDIDGQAVLFRVPTTAVQGMRAVPGKNQLVLWSATEVRLVDGETGKQLAVFEIATDERIEDVDLSPDGARVIVTRATVWSTPDDGSPALPSTHLDVLEAASLHVACALEARTCSSELVVAPDGVRAFLAPTVCAKDPVTVVDVGVSCKVVKQLAGFGPVALSPDGGTAVAFLDRDARDPAAPPVPEAVKLSPSRYHLSFIDVATLGYETFAVGDAMPRYALSPDGSRLLLDAEDASHNVRILEVDTRVLRDVSGPHTLLEEYVLLPDGKSLYTLTGDSVSTTSTTADGKTKTHVESVENLLRVDFEASTSRLVNVPFSPTSLNRLPDGSVVLVRDTQGDVHLLAPEDDRVVGRIDLVR